MSKNREGDENEENGENEENEKNEKDKENKEGPIIPGLVNDAIINHIFPDIFEIRKNKLDKYEVDSGFIPYSKSNDIILNFRLFCVNKLWYKYAMLSIKSLYLYNNIYIDKYDDFSSITHIYNSLTHKSSIYVYNHDIFKNINKLTNITSIHIQRSDYLRDDHINNLTNLLSFTL